MPRRNRCPGRRPARNTQSYVSRDRVSLAAPHAELLADARDRHARGSRRDAAAFPFTDMFDFSTPALLKPPEMPVQEAEGVCDFTLAS